MLGGGQGALSRVPHPLQASWLLPLQCDLIAPGQGSLLFTQLSGILMPPQIARAEIFKAT